jgi:hypothetical protein
MDQGTPLRRRDLARLLLALPAVPDLARANEGQKAVEKPSPTAEFLAGQEAGLSPEETEALKKSIFGFEKSLKAIRDFKLATDVSPSVRFAAMKSRSR